MKILRFYGVAAVSLLVAACAKDLVPTDWLWEQTLVNSVDTTHTLLPAEDGIQVFSSDVTGVNLLTQYSWEGALIAETLLPLIEQNIKLTPLSDGSYLSISTQQSAIKNFANLSSSYNPIWKIESADSGPNDRFVHFAMDTDQQYLAVSQLSYSEIEGGFNEEGNVLKQYLVSDDLDIEHVAVTQSGTVYFSVSDGSNEGDVLMSVAYDSEYVGYFKLTGVVDALSTIEKDPLFVYRNNGEKIPLVKLYRFSIFGNDSWDTKLGSGFIAEGIKFEDNMIYLYGNNMLRGVNAIKLDAAGSIVWDTSLGNSQQASQLSLDVDSKNNVVLSYLNTDAPVFSTNGEWTITKNLVHSWLDQDGESTREIIQDSYVEKKDDLIGEPTYVHEGPTTHLGMLMSEMGQVVILSDMEGESNLEKTNIYSY